MDIPRGHAAMPLQEADFLDFIFNYFKAEYAPIRSFWSTATALPLQPGRWINMGHEVCPLVIRPANAQAQKDLESLDFFTRKWNLDAGFVRGLVIRFSKYELHERMEKKLYECARLDLMVRKALKEKHLIDALWPSPAPKNLPTELLQQGVQVRKWYGDMFNKYFQVLHSIEQFELRPEVDLRMKNSGTLMLIPFVDHLVFGEVAPIMPIVARGAGYSNAKGWEKKDRKTPGFGEPGRFEIRFDAPSEVTDTYTKSVVRQCQCMKCGTKRDVQVMISIDPNPNAGAAAVVASSSRAPDAAPSSQKRHTSKTAQRYSPGYRMPAEQKPAPRPPQPQPQELEAPRAASPIKKKPCPRCTFLNHPDLAVCEICQGDLPATTVAKPPSPAAVKKASHSHSASLPAQAPRVEPQDKDERPAPPNRHTLSQSLFSIFPFSQQQQQQQQDHLQTHQQPTHPPAQHAPPPEPNRPSSKAGKQPTPKEAPQPHPPSTPPPPAAPPTDLLDTSSPLSRAPEMAMMPLTPDPTHQRAAPLGLPSNLMDDFVPVSPAFVHEDDEADAGWGEMSREEASDAEEEDEDEGEREERRSGGFIDLDEVAREEAGVWGEREDED